MKQELFTVISNEALTGSVYKMTLAGETDAITRPGQFVNIKLDGLFLRRPISVCDLDSGLLTIVYKVVGRGTEQMSKMTGGEKLDILSGLGNGYEVYELQAKKPVVIGGGAGVPPMYYLARELIKNKMVPTVIMGFNTCGEIFFEDEFRKLGCSVTVTTVDGSYGTKGFVTDAFPEDYDYTFACGPEAMLKAVFRASNCPGQYSFEERMGCGFGACMGCSCKTVTGYKRICKDGPVLMKEEILWED